MKANEMKRFIPILVSSLNRLTGEEYCANFESHYGGWALEGGIFRQSYCLETAQMYWYLCGLIDALTSVKISNK